MIREGAFSHVFLPRQLPDVLSESGIAQDETFILGQLQDALVAMGDAVPRSVANLFKSMNDLQKDETREIVFSQMKNFKKSDLLGFYLPQQNCALLLRSLKAGKATFAYFQTSLAGSTVYGEDVKTDIQVENADLRNFKCSKCSMVSSNQGELPDPSDHSAAKRDDKKRGIQQTTYFSDGKRAATGEAETGESR